VVDEVREVVSGWQEIARVKGVEDLRLRNLLFKFALQAK